MPRRPSAVILDMRAQSDPAKASSTKPIGTKPIIRVHKHARFCPSGHCFRRVSLVERQLSIREEQRQDFDSPLPPIECNGCGAEIQTEFISGSCKACDMDFCEDCYHSGVPIEDLLEEGLGSEADATASLSMSEMTMSVTNERCALGHPLCRVATKRRMQYLQERDGLPFAPMIECDCCSKRISSPFIAGCCVDCDMDFCEACFQSGQSFEDILHDRRVMMDEGQPDVFDERYNRIRPTYKVTGRVNYDDYPDPTSFQWSFTGSREMASVEFFEKDYGPKVGIVKLDFFYAKGKVRTTLHHRKKGEMPLFTGNKMVSSRHFRKILLDPCYHRERQKKKRLVV